MPRSFHMFSLNLQNDAKPGTVAHAVIPVIRLGQEHICDFKASVVREREVQSSQSYIVRSRLQNKPAPEKKKKVFWKQKSVTYYRIF